MVDSKNIGVRLHEEGEERVSWRQKGKWRGATHTPWLVEKPGGHHKLWQRCVELRGTEEDGEDEVAEGGNCEVGEVSGDLGQGCNEGGDSAVYEPVKLGIKAEITSEKGVGWAVEIDY